MRHIQFQSISASFQLLDTNVAGKDQQLYCVRTKFSLLSSGQTVRDAYFSLQFNVFCIYLHFTLYFVILLYLLKKDL